MTFPIKADIIGLIKGIVNTLQPYASAHDIDLNFESEVIDKQAFYQPEKIISDITNLTCRVITFTPQNYHVELAYRNCRQTEDYTVIEISNTGVNLAVMREIIRGMIYPVQRISKKCGSCFLIQIPTQATDFQPASPNSSNIDHSPIKPWYSEIRKRLTIHFSNTQHHDSALRQYNKREEIFINKINAIIFHHLEQEEFNTEKLARKVALSRTQLFRRLKQLTRMAPGQYIRFIRLQKAKEILEKSDLNVNEVAYQVGFVSNSHFSRAFYRQFGIKPSELK